MIMDGRLVLAREVTDRAERWDVRDGMIPECLSKLEGEGETDFISRVRLFNVC